MKRGTNSKQFIGRTGLILVSLLSLVSLAAATSDTSVSGAVLAMDAVTPLRIVVLDFSSASGKAFTSCAVTVSPMLEAGGELSLQIAERLNAWPEYSVLDPSIVGRAISKHRLAKKGLSKPETLARLAEVTGADAVVVGQTEGSTWKGKGHSGASLYASMQLVSTRNADVLWTIDGSVTDTQSKKDVVPNLAKDVTERLYAQLQGLEDVKALIALNAHKP